MPDPEVSLAGFHEQIEAGLSGVSDTYEDLPPTQALALEVLAARWRLGEQLWTFSTRHRPALEALQRRGLVSLMHGTVEHTCRALLTDEGRAYVLLDGYVNPVDVQRVFTENMEWLAAAGFDVVAGQAKAPGVGGWYVALEHLDLDEPSEFRAETLAAAMVAARQWAEVQGMVP